MKELTSLFPGMEENQKKHRIPVLRVRLVRDGSETNYLNTIRYPGDAADILEKHFEEADREVFTILLLNTKQKVIGIHDVSVGSLTASVVHPREVFKAAVLANAASMIIAHNHPSGDPSPSKEDLNITRLLIDAGKLMDIPVLDHIIVGDNKYISLKEENMIA